ncbi:NADH-quinone oxidoreductase subunit C [Sandarakinorhabdus rubra]|uniref:NADH-quinone oxidoreductase subunit C n=1 Tax=Sandarakinorhabdus rubra TaxID=2672568 RepID=UPI002E2CFA89|nr:NADH-quinone oxidoreductase subunit C [Sandarakinorhabdus rubra]
MSPELGVNSWPVMARHEGLPERLLALLGDAVVEIAERTDETAVVVLRDRLVEVVAALRDAPDLRFNQLIDICAADYPDRAERFEVVVHLLSMAKNLRLRVKVATDGQAPVPSLTALYPNAGWYERETWDCYGVMFAGNPDMRRILTDYGFEGHPFRKDFPLTGHVELRWSEEAKRVAYEPVRLAQDFRSFDFLSPWEGTDYVLPGDEKAGQP